MNIYCLSEGELYRIENGKELRVPCERVESYRDAVRKMKARDEWKTTGKGAKFMGVEQKEYGEEEMYNMLRGIGACGDRLIYSTFADNVGGMYFKDGKGETYIFANREEIISDIDCSGGKCVVSAGNGHYENHIALVNTDNGSFEQLTEGLQAKLTRLFHVVTMIYSIIRQWALRLTEAETLQKKARVRYVFSIHGAEQ